MLTELPASGLLAVLVALAPAVLRVWWGRPLVRLADDPALPERLVANRRRNLQATAACSAVLVAGWTSWALWTLPLLVIARLVAAYPLRKQLYGETWSLGGYLSFYTRLVITVFGFWVLLALFPYLSLSVSSRGWIVGMAIALTLVVWNARSAQLLRWVMRAQPINDVALLSRFESMVAASGIPSPRFEYVDLAGGSVANAVAVPGLRGGVVIFTDTLLARLETNEIVAICAHELAHLEYYNRTRMVRLHAATLVLIGLGAAIAPLQRLLSHDASGVLAAALWPCVMLAFLLWRARDRQKNETASDLRAVTLCGDAEALTSALTKLHTFARLPRRWDAQHERQATHPSLARRLRDIHAAAGKAPEGLASTASFSAPQGRAAVTFERGHLTWQEGEAATHRFSYAHLTELRVDVPVSGAPRLVAVESTGRRWEMPLRPDEIGHAQRILDEVDGQLSQPVHVTSVSPASARLFSAMAALVGFAAGHFSLGLVALIAAWRCAAPFVVAAGTAAMTAAALSLRDGHGQSVRWMAGPLALVGVALLALGWIKRGEAAQSGVARTTALLAALAAVSYAELLSQGINPVRLHQAARVNHAAPIFMVALAGALICSRLRVARYIAALVAAPAVLAIVAGSTWFLDRAGRDPLLVQAEPQPFISLNGAPVSQLEVSFDVGELRLSPHGASIAVSRSEDEDSPEDNSTFHIGPAKGPLTSIKADDLAFIDDDRAVIMSAGDGGADVRAVKVDNPQADTWRVHVADVHAGELSVNAATRRWQILGWDRARRIVRAQGRIDDRAVDITHWNSFAPTGAWLNATATSGTTLLAVDKRYDRGIIGGAMARSIYLPLFPLRHESRVWRVTPDVQSQMSTSLLDADCTAHVIADQLVCTAYDGMRTGLLRIDAATATPIPIGSVSGRFIASGSRSPGWLTGWLDSMPAAFRVTTRDAVRVTAFPPPTLIAAGTDAVGTVSAGSGGWLIRVYRF